MNNPNNESSIDTVIVTVEFDKYPSKVDIRPHYDYGGAVFESLRESGFIDSDGTVLFPFHMEEARPVLQDNGKYSLTFEYEKGLSIRSVNHSFGRW